MYWYLVVGQKKKQKQQRKKKIINIKNAITNLFCNSFVSLLVFRILMK